MQKLLVNNDVLFRKVTELLANGQKVTIPVKGTSMLPFIVGNRDLVTLESVSDVHVGDIVLILFEGRYILHRVICLKDGKVTTMGDGVTGRTETVPSEAVLGKVVEIFRSSSRSIDPDSRSSRRHFAIWYRLRPIRSFLLKVMWHLPGCRNEFRKALEQ